MAEHEPQRKHGRKAKAGPKRARGRDADRECAGTISAPGGVEDSEEPGSIAWLKALPTADQRDLLVAFASPGGMDAAKELAASRWGVALKADELLELVIAWGVRHQMQSATGKLVRADGGGVTEPPDDAWVESWEKAAQFILEMRALAMTASGDFRQWNAFRLKKGLAAGGRGAGTRDGAGGFANYAAKLAAMTPAEREAYRRRILEILGI